MKTLIGSTKQTEWAEGIRADIINTAPAGIANAILTKAIVYISDINSAKFWIDYKSANMTKLLQQLAKGTLRVKGLVSNQTAKIDSAGKIVETWKEIINDGKGGHWEQRTKDIIIS